ncbi:MAG: hypothetical protein Kow0092_35160 [Deferrisomatales bacterium]
MKRILACHDGSEEASRGLVDFVKAQGEPVHVTVFHVLEHFPPGLLEHEGSEIPEEKEALERQVEERRRRWIAERSAAVEPTLRAVVGELEELSPRGETPELKIVPSYVVNDFLPLLQDEVDTGRYDEVVVVHHPHSWWKQFLHRTETERVSKKLHNVSVRVVECPPAEG